ncbi:hypothetical protein [Aggregatilinea lenta]|uniref:hypothetical protein n=1 Tax=Aggregatilinea lenta TaxID=913108 RepID=UPI000E5BBDBD|nr:hypothetical protein [Aggregatilinea lenta]
MPESLQNTLVYVTGAFFVLALLLVLISLRLFRRSRTDVFWRRRREAGQRGWRLFLLGGVLLVLSAVACVSSVALSIFGEEDTTPAIPTEIAGGRTADVLDEVTATDTLEALPTTALVDEAITLPPQPVEPTEPVVTPTPAPTVVVIITATPPLTTPLPTPFATFTPYVTPVVSSVTPSPDAALEITALDSAISDQLGPVNPATRFEAGIKRIYLFVDFSNMAQGVLWKRELYHDGDLLDGNTYLWGSESDGSSYFFFGSDTGFVAGDYEIRLYIGESNTPVSSARFTVTEPSS